MSFEADLSAHLLGVTAITDLLAADANGLKCVWPGIRPEGSGTPCIVTTIVTEDPEVDFDGTDAADAGLDTIRVQIDCYATSYDLARQLARAVRARMNTAASSFAAAPFEGGGGDVAEPETKLHRVVREYQCWYTPA